MAYAWRDFLWSQWRGKRSRHSIRNPQFLHIWYKAYVHKIVYGQLMRPDGNGPAIRCKYVKDLLFNFSMKKHLENNQNVDLNILRNFVSNFRTENGSRFKRVLNTEVSVIGKHSAFETYTIFKKNHKMETYFMHVWKYKTRRWRTRLRVSFHRLRIETGRHQNPHLPSKQRLC